MACVSSSHVLVADAVASPHLLSPRQWKTVQTNQSTPGAKSMPLPNHKPLLGKSPMSLCIATIMGAAAAVHEEDVTMVQQKWMKKSKRTSSKKGGAKGSPAESPLAFSVRPSDPLAVQLADEVFFKRLVFTMALERPRVVVGGSQDSQISHNKVPPQTIGEGFYWKDYPHLEKVLLVHMEEYYEWSTKERQSKQQQHFNNALVEKVRHVATSHGNDFDSLIFDDKRLRDRIRCFYKTSLQNAKKRLRTMKKNLTRHGTLLMALVNKTHRPPKNGRPRLVSISSLDDERRPERKGF